MAKVFYPLMSQVASGDFAKTLQFVCGRFCRIKNDQARDPNTAYQERQRIKFAQAVLNWNSVLSSDTKKKWQAFAKLIAAQNTCIDAAARITGYNLWVTYWLRYSEYGWPFYPDPPIWFY